MFIRKYWLPLSVFLIAIIGVGLYLLQTQPPKDPIKSDKAATAVEIKPIPLPDDYPRTITTRPTLSNPEGNPTSPVTVSCVGGCGQTGAEMFIWNSWRNYGRPMSREQLRQFGVRPEDSDQDIKLVTIVSHRYHCEEKSRSSFLSLPTTINCPGVYYNCNGQTSADCPNAENHITEETN